ncbi:MAG: Inositol 2-dehydrogenase/D-chiro-inositol 3-dehydrogenase [Phycisphaerae bacterium]|nr:Inositol 2-dehydrogenase/D-chiro-inositol 3-dehydrogenase [Phycisphaerae bacterium]
MGEPLQTVLCGIGGFGERYLGEFWGRPDVPVRFVGFVDPFPERAAFAGRIRDAGHAVHAVHADLEAFFAAGGRADLAIIASPIQHHAGQTLCALAHGCHVLCEKPLCATLDDARRMLAARDAAGRTVAVGYQMAYSDAAARFKADILAGDWGRPLACKCIAAAPRSREYYLRNAWAGRINDRVGRPVLDSPVNNANAHYLHLMLHLLGPAVARAAFPVRVQALLCRAHAIENYDTAFLAARLDNDVDLFFVTSHVGLRGQGRTQFEFAFERGRVRGDEDGSLVGTFADGATRDYGRVLHFDQRKVNEVADAIAAGREAACGIESAMAHTLCVAAVQESGWPPADIPRSLVRKVDIEGHPWLQVAGMDEIMQQSYAAAALPSPSPVTPWLRPGRMIDLPADR